MRIFYGLDHLPHFLRPTATVGSYDGVHGGHQALLDAVIRTAREQGGESIVLTFEPHPRITLGTATGLRLLTTVKEKALLLEQAGIDNLIVIPFDRAFSRLTPYEFVHDYLIGRLGVANLVVGYNHRFGHDKEGSYDYLDRLHDEFGFRAIRIAEYGPDAEKISSTVIRRLIEQGEVAHAARMLQHPYLVLGQSASKTIRIAEPLKLLPQPGDYPVIAGGVAATLTVGSNDTLEIDKCLPTGEVLITFES